MIFGVVTGFGPSSKVKATTFPTFLSGTKIGAKRAVLWKKIPMKKTAMYKMIGMHIKKKWAFVYAITSKEKRNKKVSKKKTGLLSRIPSRLLFLFHQKTINAFYQNPPKLSTYQTQFSFCLHHKPEAFLKALLNPGESTQ
jgi:hypothetical protein